MSQKKEASLLRLAVVWTCIALVAGLALTGVYALTKDRIDAAQKAKKEMALNLVLPDFKGTLVDTTVTPDGEDDPVLAHIALNDDGSLFGVAVETFTKKAFDGRFDLMVGLDADGRIINTEVIDASETPGLGDKINKDNAKFMGQWKGFNPAIKKLSVKKDGGDVDAITASTITSRAYTLAVENALKVFAEINGGESNE